MHARTEQDQTSQMTKGPIKSNQQEPHSQRQRGPLAHARSRPDVISHRAGHTDHEDSSVAISARVHEQKRQRWKHNKKEKRAHRYKWWIQRLNQAMAYTQ